MADFVSIRQAADLLDCTTQHVWKLRSDGSLTAGGGANVAQQTVSRADVVRLSRLHRARAIRRIEDLTGWATELRRLMHPSPESQGNALRAGSVTKSGVDALSPSRLRTAQLVFGSSAVRFAAKDHAGICGFCWAHQAARVLGSPDPDGTAPWRALLGHDPCPVDVRRWDSAMTASAAARRRVQADVVQAAADAVVARAQHAQKAVHRGATDRCDCGRCPA